MSNNHLMEIISSILIIAVVTGLGTYFWYDYKTRMSKYQQQFPYLDTDIDSALLPFNVLIYNSFATNYTINVLDGRFPSTETHIMGDYKWSLPIGETGNNVTVCVNDEIYHFVVPSPHYYFDGHFNNCQAYWEITINGTESTIK